MRLDTELIPYNAILIHFKNVIDQFCSVWMLQGNVMPCLDMTEAITEQRIHTMKRKPQMDTNKA